MKNISFTKMHGCGNDFIIIDNRNGMLQGIDLEKFVKDCCNRKFHIGADGLMLIENSQTSDFSMRYFNADGSEGKMCGNGARCIANYAFQHGIASEQMVFETLAGLYKAHILDDENVVLYFPPVPVREMKLHRNLKLDQKQYDYHFLEVGVPHTIIFQKDRLIDGSFEKWGRRVRHHHHFSPNGTNVNLVEIKENGNLFIRSYERGVEAETLACGSGATAAAIVYALIYQVQSPVHVETKGGKLKIHFEMHESEINSITLTGPARTSFSGSFVYETSERSV